MRAKPWHSVTKPIPKGVFGACFLALFALSSRAPVWSDPKVLEPGTGEGPSLRTFATLASQGNFSLALRLEDDAGVSVLGLAVDGDGAELRGALRLGPLVCGPGRLAGPASFLSSPVSLSATPLGGGSFKVDTGLASGLSVLALDLGAVTAFALCRNGSKGFFAGAAGLAAGTTAAGAAGFSFAPRPIPGDSGCATGLVARIDTEGGDLAFVAAASRSGPPAPGDGWRLDASPDPGGFGLATGLAYEARGQGWRSAFGLDYSWGPLRGVGSAARFEGSAILEPFRLSLQAGYAAAQFRDCLGEGEGRGAAIALGCSLPLWNGATFRSSFRIECPSLADTWPRGAAMCDLVERSASLSLSMRAGGPSPGPGVLRLRSGLSFGMDSAGSAFLAPDLDVSGRTGISAWNAGLSGRWVRAPGEATASPSLKAMFKAVTASSGPFSLEARYGLSWKAGTMPTLDASLGITLAAFGDGRISVFAEWLGLGLAIAGSGEDASAPGFGLRYSLAQ